MTTTTATRRRPMVVDAQEIAKNYREVFTQKSQTKRREFPFTWPSKLQHVGDSIAVAYDSDKWKREGDFELYKHLAESRNRALVRPGFLHSYERQSTRIRTIGPTVDFAGVPMPREISMLAYFEEAHLVLYTEGTDEKPRFARDEDEGVVRVFVRRAMLGCSKIRWSLVDKDMKDEPFLCVYTEPDGKDRGGMHMMIVGEELDVEADGIVG